MVLHGHEALQKEADLWFGHSKRSVVTLEYSYELAETNITVGH